MVRMPGRSAVALILAFWVVVIGAQWTLPGTDIAPAHGPHALQSAVHPELPGHAEHTHVIAEHPHMQDASVPQVPDTLVEAVMPRANTALLALGVLTVVALLAPLWHQTPLAGIRGPPRAFPRVLTGRVILTRLCIARR